MTGPPSGTPRSMPSIDGTRLPPPSAPAALSPISRPQRRRGSHSPGTEEGCPQACRGAAMAPHRLCRHFPALRTPHGLEPRGASVSPESMNPRPTAPGRAPGQPPGAARPCPCQCPAQPAGRRLGGVSAEWAWRPTASQADVMANSRHLAYLRDF